MTFDPVLPPLVLGVVAVVLVALRLLALRTTVRAGGRSMLRWGVTTLAFLLLLLAATRPGAGPVAQGESASRTGGGANVYLLVDRSADSAIADFGGSSRMAAIRKDIEAVIDAHPGARFAVISFASRPAIDWPLSDDAWSLRPVVDALTPYSGPTAAADQANAGAAANVVRYQLIAAGQQYPRSENLVYYFGSGAAQSSTPQGEFDTDAVDGGAVFGYGAGDQRLRAFAGQLGVPYVQRRPGEALPPAPGAAAQPLSEAAQATHQRDEFYWLLTLIASALLLIEIHLSVRDLRLSRSSRREMLR